ncbi:hypothetical protein EVAR_94464_1 [Eumeta japonica]|uniref:Uncharacterized protein n=1 Tax=Eumeta variegata TaxID=151549 RepID=A0A4C1SV57_EUMVA|nr:hypothetical protein EVAR_94464_1 [Eumeta japonica]
MAAAYGYLAPHISCQCVDGFLSRNRIFDGGGIGGGGGMMERRNQNSYSLNEILQRKLLVRIQTRYPPVRGEVLQRDASVALPESTREPMVRSLRNVTFKLLDYRTKSTASKRRSCASDVSPARMNVAARGAPSEGVQAVYLKLDLPGVLLNFLENTTPRAEPPARAGLAPAARVVSFRLSKFAGIGKGLVALL